MRSIPSSSFAWHRYEEMVDALAARLTKEESVFVAATLASRERVTDGEVSAALEQVALTRAGPVAFVDDTKHPAASMTGIGAGFAAQEKWGEEEGVTFPKEKRGWAEVAPWQSISAHLERIN